VQFVFSFYFFIPLLSEDENRFDVITTIHMHNIFSLPEEIKFHFKIIFSTKFNSVVAPHVRDSSIVACEITGVHAPPCGAPLAVKLVRTLCDHVFWNFFSQTLFFDGSSGAVLLWCLFIVPRRKVPSVPRNVLPFSHGDDNRRVVFRQTDTHLVQIPR
jgi:hypothetical protein